MFDDVDRISGIPTRVTACDSNAVAIVEDDRVLREAISAALRDIGLAPHTASTLPNARKIIGVVHPCAIVLDVHLGYEDAMALLDELDAEGVGVPVVVISADVASLRKARRRERTLFLEKPFDLNCLVDALLAAVAA